MTMTAVTPRLLDDLILARLLVVGKRPLGPKKLSDSVTRLCQTPPSAEQWETTLQELEQSGLLTRSPIQLTAAGCARALAFLELDAVPPRFNWGTVQSRCLVPKALGVPSDQKARQRLKIANNLRAAALRKTYRLSIPENSPLGKTVEAVACQLICERLGIEPRTNMKELQYTVLNTLLNPSVPLEHKKIAEQLPGHALGVTRAGLEGLRHAILMHWLENANGAQQPLTSPTPVNSTVPEPRPVEPPPLEPRELHLDPAIFAATVQAASRSCPTGHWGDNKIFINHVWRQLQQEPNFPQLELAAFKERLNEANQRGLLRLERADLVEAMNPDDVRESETTFLTATYHFLLIERDRP
jgi:hypothetical protein